MWPDLLDIGDLLDSAEWYSRRRREELLTCLDADNRVFRGDDGIAERDGRLCHQVVFQIQIATLTCPVTFRMMPGSECCSVCLCFDHGVKCLISLCPYQPLWLFGPMVRLT